MSESQIQSAILEYLTSRGFCVWRRNCAGIIKAPKGGRMRIGEKGQADIYGWDKDGGRHIEVEVKAPGCFPTAAQVSWLSVAKSCGCIAFWANSVEMCATELNRQI